MYTYKQYICLYTYVEMIANVFEYRSYLKCYHISIYKLIIYHLYIYICCVYLVWSYGR